MSPADELVDIISANDEVVGTVTRAEMRRRNLPHRCVYILVFASDGRLLIHQRTTSKDVYPGFWDVAFGGVLAAGESYDEAARRELFEECGVADATLATLFSMPYEDPSTRVVGRVYRVTSDGPFRLQETEVQRCEWIELTALSGLRAQRSFCPDGLAVLDRFLSKRTA